MNPFSSRGLAILIGAGLSTFVLGLLLAAFGPEVFDRHSAGNDSFSRSLIGHRALTELLKRSGLVVVVSRNASRQRATASFPLLLLEPEPALETLAAAPLAEPGDDRLADLDRDQRLERLIAGARDNGAEVVVVLPKWIARPSARRPGWIDRRRPMSAARIERLLGELQRAAAPDTELAEAPRDDGSGGPQPDLALRRVEAVGRPRPGPLAPSAEGLEMGPPVQLLAPAAGLEPLLAFDQGVLVGRLAGGLTLVSDPELINNHGLGLGGHAALVLALLRERLGAQGVVLDETLHGFSAGDSLLARALRFPLLVIVVHALLAMALAAWSLAARFGKPLPPPPELPPGKRLLLDNTARLLLAGGDHGRALRSYLRMTLNRLARRFGVAGAGSTAVEQPDQPELDLDLVARLQAIGEARGFGLDLAALVRRGHNSGLRPAEALRLARRLHAWRQALQGAPAADRSRPEA